MADKTFWQTIELTGDPLVKTVRELIEAGKVQKIVLTDPGAGFSSEPQVTVQGFADVRL